MSQVTDVVCDNCGVRKSDRTQNKWVVAVITDKAIGEEVFKIAKKGEFKDGKDYCSQQCLETALSHFLYPEDVYKEEVLVESDK